jgi:hypothetical protein
MKIAALVILLFCSVNAFAKINLECSNGNSHLILAAAGHQVQTTLVNASGVQDASGTLNCTGPMQSAYSCEGKLNLLDSRDTLQVRLVIPVSTLQGGGVVVFNDGRYTCGKK